jgi:hypothetical protein
MIFKDLYYEIVPYCGDNDLRLLCRDFIEIYDKFHNVQISFNKQDLRERDCEYIFNNFFFNNYRSKYYKIIKKRRNKYIIGKLFNNTYTEYSVNYDRSVPYDLGIYNTKHNTKLSCINNINDIFNIIFVLDKHTNRSIDDFKLNLFIMLGTDYKTMYKVHLNYFEYQPSSYGIDKYINYCKRHMIFVHVLLLSILMFYFVFINDITTIGVSLYNTSVMFYIVYFISSYV